MKLKNISGANLIITGAVTGRFYQVPEDGIVEVPDGEFDHLPVGEFEPTKEKATVAGVEMPKQQMVIVQTGSGPAAGGTSRA